MEECEHSQLKAIDNHWAVKAMNEGKTSEVLMSREYQCQSCFCVVSIATACVAIKPPQEFCDIDDEIMRLLCEQCALYGTDCESDPSGSCFVAKS